MVGGDKQTLRTMRVISREHSIARDTSHLKTRVGVAVLAAIGFIIATYLAAYQAGFVREVWEPFFGQGSARVLHSFMSTLLPIPDAAIGAIGYAVEFVFTVAGKADRWFSRPKLVLVYGVIVAAMGVAGLTLVAVQAFVLHDFCTLCMASAIISLVIAFLAHDEVLASFKVLYHERKR